MPNIEKTIDNIYKVIYNKGVKRREEPLGEQK